MLPLDDTRPDESEKRPAYIELLKACCRKGFTPNLCGSSGHSALMRACMAGDEEVVKILLDHNADINLSCSVQNHIQSGYTPLHYAITGRHIPLAVGLILIHRANSMAQAANLNSPLFLALTEGVPMLRDLFVAAIETNGTQLNLSASHQNGKTLLHAAVEAYNRIEDQGNEQSDQEETNITDAITFLLMSGINKDIPTKDTGQTAAQMADSAGNNELATNIREFIRPSPSKSARNVQ